jgi:hypothetical protein
MIKLFLISLFLMIPTRLLAQTAKSQPCVYAKSKKTRQNKLPAVPLKRIFGRLTYPALQTTEMKNHAYGLDYGTGVNGNIGNQVDKGNRFTGTYTIAAARNQAATYDAGTNVVTGPGILKANKYNGATVTTFWGGGLNRQMIGQGTVHDWFTDSPNTQASCTNPSSLVNTGGGDEGLTNAEQTALGVFQAPEYATEMAYASKRGLYESLVDGTADSLLNSPIIQDFADSLVMTATADLVDLQQNSVLNLSASEQLKLQMTAFETQIAGLQTQLEAATDPVQKANVESLLEANYTAYTQAIAAFEAAQDLKAAVLETQNAAIQPVLLQDVNEKAVNDIYFRRIAQSDTELAATDADAVLLSSIAAQCPYTGGEAVYKARSIAAGINPLVVYDDTNICATQGVNFRQQKPVASGEALALKAKAYPNPASTYIVVETTVPTASGSVILTDMLGKIVQVNAWNDQQTKQLIIVEGLVSGIYSIKLHTETQDFVLGKVAIVHP